MMEAEGNIFEKAAIITSKKYNSYYFDVLLNKIDLIGADYFYAQARKK